MSLTGLRGEEKRQQDYAAVLRKLEPRKKGIPRPDRQDLAALKHMLMAESQVNEYVEGILGTWSSRSSNHANLYSASCNEVMGGYGNNPSFHKKCEPLTLILQCWLFRFENRY